MIWTDGRIIPDSELRVSALDRSFEHGLGLFETLRTWNGHATLLPRHLDRLRNSARTLGLPLAGVVFPNAEDVAALRQNTQPDGDVLLRLVLSGGLNANHGAILWMHTRALTSTPTSAPEGVVPDPDGRPGPSFPTPAVIRDTVPVWEDDPLARHKTLNYWSRRIAHERAVASGADEVLTHSGPDTHRRLWEGSRTSLFVVREGALVTPPRDGPLLPGVMRSVVLEFARKNGITSHERIINQSELPHCTEAFLTNSGRGIWPVSGLLGHTLPAPGPLTSRLWGAILPWLESGGDPT